MNLKKIFKQKLITSFSMSRFFYFVLGGIMSVSFVFLGIFIAIAAGTAPTASPAIPWAGGANAGVDVGNVLTASRWNGMINKIANLESNPAWPAGPYCIIQAVNNSCPPGFTSVNPQQAPNGDLGAESVLIAGGNSSTQSATNKAWGMNNADSVEYLRWAWCCKS
jgi:hypothetical protein